MMRLRTTTAARGYRLRGSGRALVMKQMMLVIPGCCPDALPKGSAQFP